MILVPPHAEVLSATPDIAINIERAGRTCYKSEAKIGCTLHEDRCQELVCHECEHHSSHKFVQKMLQNGHHAMLEHASITVRFVTDRGISHEMVRHRVASYAQESTRYVDYTKENHIQITLPDCFPYLVAFSNKEIGYNDVCVDEEPENFAAHRWMIAMLDAEAAYFTLRHHKVPPEQARDVLPTALKTEIIVTANLREWLHIYALRYLGNTGRPHPRYRRLLHQLLPQMVAHAPAVFSHIKPVEGL